MSTAALAVKTDVHALDIHPVAGRIGAEIRGIKLSGDLDPATVDAIQQALLTHKVIFFRNQTHLDDQRQEAFAHLLGEPIAHPTVPVRDGTQYLMELDGAQGQRANSWHTDVTFVDAYPKASVLRSVLAPASGGDTVWANTARAYEQLPETLKRFVDTLRAVHSNDYDYGAERTVVETHRLAHHQKVFVSALWEAEHPVVHVHPVSGERALLLGHFVKRLVGFSSRESAQLFELLQNRIIRLDNTVRWQWQQDDVVIWDNRSTQHYAVNDYGTQPRVVRRVTVEGEIAVGVDGSKSRTVSRPQDAANGESTVVKVS